MINDVKTINQAVSLQEGKIVDLYSKTGNSTNPKVMYNGIPTSGITCKGNKLQINQKGMEIVDYDKKYH